MPALVCTLGVLDVLSGCFVWQPQQTDAEPGAAVGPWKALVLCSTSERSRGEKDPSQGLYVQLPEVPGNSVSCWEKELSLL